MIELKNKKIVIATHVYATGPAQDLRDYLLNKKIEELLFIGHPLFYDQKLKGSGFELYKKGELRKEVYGKIKKIPAIILFVGSLFLNIWWIVRSGEKYDLYVGSNNLNTLSGIILRYFGKVKKVIYYVIDYNPKRFKNRFLNSIYHRIDRFCIKHADETWNLSPRMEIARKEYFGFSGGKQKVVPLGVWFDRIRKNNPIPSKEHILIFMGHITEKQGIQSVLKAVPLIVKQIPDFKFLVIGGGNFSETLKKQAEGLGIDDNVEFTGFIEKQSDLEKLVARGSLAIAMYGKYDADGNLSFTYFADPGKIKAYLATGLPVLLSDVPYNAKELEERRCGFVINQDKNEIAQKVIMIMKDQDILREYQENAINYAREFDWNNIYENNLGSLIS